MTATGPRGQSLVGFGSLVGSYRNAGPRCTPISACCRFSPPLLLETAVLLLDLQLAQVLFQAIKALLGRLLSGLLEVEDCLLTVRATGVMVRQLVVVVRQA